MDVTPQATTDNTAVVPPQVSPAPPAAVATPPAAAPAQAPAEPQFDPRKWSHMKEILDRDPDARAKVLSDLGGVPMAQYLDDHKRTLCATLSIPEDKQYLVHGGTVAELAKSANDVAALLKPAGNPPAADPSAPSAPAPPPPVQHQPITPQPLDVSTRQGTTDAVLARMRGQG